MSANNNNLKPKRPTFHRAKGSFAEELTNARTDLDRKLRESEDAETPSLPETAPSLSPTGSATPSTPESEAGSPVSPPLDDGEQDVVADGFAFAFDIDGVLVRGGRAIPEALEAMKVLNGENQYGIKM